MIEFFHTDEESRSLTKLDTEQPGCWIALFEPTAEELADVAERFAIDADDLRAPLDLEEVSRIETGPAYTMFIVDTPIRDKSLGDLSYKTIPIAIQYLKGGYGSVDWGAMMAMLVLAIVPIILFYLACQKHIIKGVAAGAVKG